MRHILIILLGFAIHQDCTSCECDHSKIDRDSSVNVGLRNSDIVFYGDLINRDTIARTYEFKILELFKGEYSKEVITGCIANSCSMFPYDKGLWIVYANKTNDSTIDIHMCGQSIPLNRSEGLVPPPPLFIDNRDKTIELLKNKVYILEKRSEGLSFWFSDLEKLRQYKRSHTIVKEKIDIRNIMLIALVLINIVLLTLLIKRRT